MLYLKTGNEISNSEGKTKLIIRHRIHTIQVIPNTKYVGRCAEKACFCLVLNEPQKHYVKKQIVERNPHRTGKRNNGQALKEEEGDDVKTGS